MLDRLRFQEIEKAIFKAREDRKYGDRYVLKGEPILIIDNAEMSRFLINERIKHMVGRSEEATTATIRNVTFDISDGKIMFDLFSTIFGETKNSQPTTFTINETILLNEEQAFNLPSVPAGKVLLYLTDDYGHLTRIAESQYNVEDKQVVLVKPVSELITYVYEEAVIDKVHTSIKQLGEDIVCSLELQCIAMDVLTEEKMRILMKFNKVSVGANASIRFNDSTGAFGTTISIQGLPEDNQNSVNKEIFTLEVI